MGIFTPPPGYGPAKLSAYAVLGFAVAGGASGAAFDSSFGIPDKSALLAAHGRVVAVGSERYGVKFRLQGRPEIFYLPSKAGGSGAAEAALDRAGSAVVSVLFEAEPRRPLFSDDRRYDVWQLTVGDRDVRTFEQSGAGWRSDNSVARWVFAFSLALGVYFALLAWRARRLQVFR